MSKKSATVLVVFIIAIVAFCLANVCALMTGTYHLNLFNEDNATANLNNTTDNQTDVNLNLQDHSSNHVQSEQHYISNPNSESGSSSGDESSGGQDSGNIPSQDSNNPESSYSYT